MKTNEQIGAEAAKIARRKVLAEARKAKLTTYRVLKRISEGLDAVENKVFYDKDRGKCIIGPDMIDHGRRLEAAGLGIVIHDMKPCEKKKIDVNHSLDKSLIDVARKVLAENPAKEDKPKAKKAKPR